MENVYNKSLNKMAIFNLAQAATPIGDVIDTPLKIKGIHHKTVTMSDGEEKLLTILFVDEDGELKSYFSSASSFYNGLKEVAALFGSEIEKDCVTLTVSQIKTRTDNTVYVIKL